MGLLSFLFGCGDEKPTGQKAGPWQQKEGAWYYRELPIEGADAKSFATLAKLTETTDAQDRSGTFRHGKRAAPQ